MSNQKDRSRGVEERIGEGEKIEHKKIGRQHRPAPGRRYGPASLAHQKELACEKTVQHCEQLKPKYEIHDGHHEKPDDCQREHQPEDRAFGFAVIRGVASFRSVYFEPDHVADSPFRFRAEMIALDMCPKIPKHSFLMMRLTFSRLGSGKNIRSPHGTGSFSEIVAREILHLRENKKKREAEHLPPS